MKPINYVDVEVFAVKPPRIMRPVIRICAYGRGGVANPSVAYFSSWELCLQAAVKLAELFGRRTIIVNDGTVLRIVDNLRWREEL